MGNVQKGRFCVLPFALLNTRGFGEARVCCTILGLNHGIPKNATLPDIADKNTYLSQEKFDLRTDSVSDLWNSKFMKDFRLRMLAGEYIDNCKDCFRMEDNGLTSKRVTKNKMFLEQLKREGLFEKCKTSNGYLDTMPFWWEVRLSTKCNVSCYMCSPRLSSKIYEDFIKNKDKIDYDDWYSAKKFDNIYKEGRKEAFLSNSAYFKQQFFKNIDSITHLEMRGGEVLFDKESVEFLEKVSLHPRAKHISFDLSTNGTIFTNTIVEIFNRFKRCTIRFSIDGFDIENEYIRYPTKWPVVVKTLTKSKKLKNSLKLIQVTLGVFQICTIHKLLWYIDSLVKKQKNDFYFSFTLVRGMTHLAHELVPLKLREKSAEKTRHFLENSYMCNKHRDKRLHQKAVLGLIRTILSEDKPKNNAKDLFFKKIPLLDKTRNQNYLEIFPHLKIL